MARISPHQDPEQRRWIHESPPQRTEDRLGTSEKRTATTASVAPNAGTVLIEPGGMHSLAAERPSAGSPYTQQSRLD